MFKFIKREIIKVTVAVAEDFLTKNTYESQRLLRETHVQELVWCLVGGTFTTGSIAISKNIFSRSEVLVNGQHQCHAVIKSGIPMIALYEQYECQNPVDLSSLYGNFDNFAPRSLANIAKPEANALNLLWSGKIISKMITAAIMIENLKKGVNICNNWMNKNEKVGLLKHYIKEGEFINEMLAGKNSEKSKHLMRGAVIAAIIMTWRKDNYNAEKFWKAIRDGEHLTSEMPTHKLRDYLMYVSISRGRGSSTGKQLVSEHEMISKCITAWNAFRKTELTTLRYSPGKPIPKAI